jgi:eukaryotic-like serine/threonine-protein kinase
VWNAPLLTPPHALGDASGPTPQARRSSRHRLLRQLGQSALTRSYLAAQRNDAGDGPLVRLELLRTELAVDADLRALFLDRAAATLSLRHPRLTVTREVVADTGAAGVVSEFVDGQTLDRILERIGRSELPLALHLRILCDVLDGLNHAHHRTSETHAQLGLVHGDISPADVLVTYDGHVKVVGVGFSQTRYAAEKKGGAPPRDIGYRAPELLLGYAPTAAADVYGVGVMLWEALAQCPRSLALDARSIAKRRTRGEEPDIDEVSTAAPKRLRSICRRALAVSRLDRHPTALELMAELEACLQELGAPSAEAASAELAELLGRRFEKEREEMQLFIGSSFVARPAPAELARPDESSDSGEHRAFAASLVPTLPTNRRFPRGVLLLAAAGVALVTGISTRWHERATAAPGASGELTRGTEPREAEIAPPAHPVGSAARAAPLSTAPSPPQPNAPSEALPPSVPAEPQPAPAAFLDLSADAAFTALGNPSLPNDAERAANDSTALQAEDLPAPIDDRARLQDALVDAARRYRARLARREAARQAALRAAARAVAEAPPAPPLVEINPYDP